MNDAPSAFPVEEHQRLYASVRYAASTVGTILERLFEPRTVLDLGCGIGTWLQVLAADGRRQVLGVERETYDRQTLVVDPDLILTADLRQSLDLQRRFDLVVCLEVAEHIEAQFADVLVETCVRHSDVVLFSTALPGQQGLGHANEQLPDYWAERFAAHGYDVLDLIRPLIWDDTQIPVWYRQNILMFANDGAAATTRIRAQAALAPARPLLAIAHPDLLRWLSAQEHAALVEADQSRQQLSVAQATFEAELAAAAQRQEIERQNRLTVEAAQEAAVRQGQAALHAATQQIATASEARQVAESALAEARQQIDALDAKLRRLESDLAGSQRQAASETSRRIALQAGLAEARQREAGAQEALRQAEAALQDAKRRQAEETAARADVRRQLDAEMRVRRQVELDLAAAKRQTASEAAARITAQAGLVEARRREAASTEALRHAEARQAEIERQRDREAAARVAVLANLAAARRREAEATEALRRAEAQQGELERQRDSEAAARDAALASLAEARRRGEVEAAARHASDAALREARRGLAVESDARRQAEDRLYRVSQELMLARHQVAALSWERHIILHSALWRMTEPLRWLGRRIPFALRLPLRRAIGAAETRDFAAAPRPTPLPTIEVARAVSDVAAPEPLDYEVTTTPPVATVAQLVPAAPQAPRLVFISGEPGTPGHVYRVQRTLEAALALGAEATWLPLSDVIARGEDIARADVLVIWRAANGTEVAHALWIARSNGVKVLFDVDDLMFDPSLATRKVIDGIRSQDLSESDVADHYQRVREVVVQADACLCTTEELARHLRELDRITFVLPNVFDASTLRRSRLAVRQRSAADDGIIRIGYASGTRTHQRDCHNAAVALGRILRETPQCRLVLFREPQSGRRLFDPAEFPALRPFSDQIEWRDRVPLDDLPGELARFDINLAPLEVGNPFCEAKSELKYFEAGLVEVCTVASPTGPMCRAIRDGVTGRLADTPQEWYRALRELINDPVARRRMAHAAYLDSLGRFGPQEATERLQSILRQLAGAEESAHAFELDLLRRRSASAPEFDIPSASVVFQADKFDDADVTVIIPLYNYAHYIEEALESVRRQTVPRLDLVVVDDASTDESLQVACAWVRRHQGRFNRVMVLRNDVNSGLARSRNVGFNAAETPFVLPLDADNRLLPDCCAVLLDALLHSRAGFAYSMLQCFNASDHVLGTEEFVPIRFASSNYIDAMALVAKWCWAKVGGYTHIRFGWEDYDFWCKCVERGLWAEHVREILAEYRVHESSMLRTSTDRPDNKRQVIRQLEDRHDWLTLTYRP